MVSDIMCFILYGISDFFMKNDEIALNFDCFLRNSMTSFTSSEFDKDDKRALAIQLGLGQLVECN